MHGPLNVKNLLHISNTPVAILREVCHKGWPRVWPKHSGGMPCL